MYIKGGVMAEVFLAVLLVMSFWSFVGADMPPSREVQIVSQEVAYSEETKTQDIEKVLDEQASTLYISGCKMAVSSAVIKEDGMVLIITTTCMKRR